MLVQCLKNMGPKHVMLYRIGGTTPKRCAVLLLPKMKPIREEVFSFKENPSRDKQVSSQLEHSHNCNLMSHHEPRGGQKSNHLLALEKCGKAIYLMSMTKAQWPQTQS